MIYSFCAPEIVVLGRKNQGMFAFQIPLASVASVVHNSKHTCQAMAKFQIICAFST